MFIERTEQGRKLATTAFSIMLLDNLVVHKTVSLMRQKIYDDYNQRLVNREFADALQCVHNSMKIVLTIESDRIIISTREKSHRWIKNESGWAIDRNYFSNFHLTKILKKIFIIFQQIAVLDMSKTDSQQEAFDDVAESVELQKLDRLYVNSNAPPIIFIEKFAHLIKNIRIVHNLNFHTLINWKQNRTQSLKLFFESLFLVYKNLRTLCIAFSYFDYLFNVPGRNGLINCLTNKTLYEKDAEILKIFANDKWLVHTLGVNKNLRYLYVEQEPEIFCSPTILPLLSHLLQLRVSLPYSNETVFNDERKNQFLLILKSLSFDALLVITVSVKFKNTGHLVEMIDDVFNLSMLTGKSIKLQVINFNRIIMIRALENLTTRTEYKELIVKSPSEKKAILQMRNVSIILSVPQSLSDLNLY
jgi:hypothetical protein